MRILRVSNGKERSGLFSARKEVVDGFARRLALADSNKERSQLVKRMLSELRQLEIVADVAPIVPAQTELSPAAE